MQCAKPMSIRGIATCICHVVTILARDARNCMLAGLRRQLLMLFFTVMSSVWVDKPFKYKPDEYCVQMLSEFEFSIVVD